MSQTPSRRHYDAAVVGAGIVGLSCAWRAAQRGLSVLVLDRGRPGAGASRAAAGMLAPVTEAEFGEEALLRLNLDGAAAWPAFAAELAERSGLGTGYHQCGALVVAVDRDDVEELRRLHAFQRSLGLDAEWLTGRECRRLEPGLSPGVAGGVLASQDHQADPRATVAALVAAIEHEGGDVVGGVEVDDLGAIPTDRVVVAAGAWAARFGDLPVRPVKGQIIRLRERTPIAERIVRTPRCYVVPRAGEVVIGATVEERGFDEAVTAGAVHRLLEAAWEALPDVEERELVETGVGFRPGTPDNLPIVGALGDGPIWATGHHRNGVLLAPVTASAVAGLLAGDELPGAMRPFAPDRFVAAGANA